MKYKLCSNGQVLSTWATELEAHEAQVIMATLISDKLVIIEEREYTNDEY